MLRGCRKGGPAVNLSRLLFESNCLRCGGKSLEMEELSETDEKRGKHGKTLQSPPFSVPNVHFLVCVSNKQYFLGNAPGDTAYTGPDYPCDPEDALELVRALIKEKSK